MYRYVLGQSIIPFFKEFIHPAICGIILSIILFLGDKIIPENNLIEQILLKGVVTFVFTVLYIQLSSQYDLIRLIRTKIRK